MLPNVKYTVCTFVQGIWNALNNMGFFSLVENTNKKSHCASCKKKTYNKYCMYFKKIAFNVIEGHNELDFALWVPKNSRKRKRKSRVA